MIETKTKICYVFFAMSLFSAAIFTIPLGGFQLSIFRFLIFVLFLLELVDLRREKEVMNRYDLLMFFWLMYAIVSFGWVSDMGNWGKSVFFLSVAFLSTRWFHLFFNTTQKIVNACKAFSCGILFHNFIGWYEIATRNYHWVSEKYLIQLTYSQTPVPVSVFYNPNDFATVLSFGIFALFVAHRYSNHRSVKILWALTLISSFILLVLTQSRANLIGVLLGISFMVMVKFGLSYKKIVISLFLLMSFAFALLFTDFGTYVSNFIDIYLNFDMENGSEQQRSILLKNAFCVFVNSYGLGTGAGNLSFRMLTDGCFSIEAGSVHNWWVEILVTYGIVIFLWYVLNYIMILKKFFLKAKESYLASNMFAFLICFVIGCISSSSCLSNEPLWCAFALVYACASIDLNSKWEKTH